VDVIVPVIVAALVVGNETVEVIEKDPEFIAPLHNL
jgi:hypothetical protein